MVRKGFFEDMMFKVDFKDEQELVVLGEWGWKEFFRQKEEYIYKLQVGKILYVRS